MGQGSTFDIAIYLYHMPLSACPITHCYAEPLLAVKPSNAPFIRDPTRTPYKCFRESIEYTLGADCHPTGLAFSTVR